MIDFLSAIFVILVMAALIMGAWALIAPVFALPALSYVQSIALYLLVLFLFGNRSPV